MFRAHRFRRNSLRTFAIASPLSLALGCASPGQPRPPSLHLPGLAEKLTGERVGAQVVLGWTTPTTATDGDRIKGAITAVVCLDNAPPTATLSAATSQRNTRKKRAAASAPVAPAACDVVLRAPAAVGPGKLVADMAPALTAGPPKLLAYQIELENAKARSAGPSAPAFVAGGAAPPAVEALNVTAQREGALVRWKAEPGAIVELKRTLIATAAGPVEANSGAAVKPANVPTPFSPTAAKTPPREVVLRAGQQDAGGMLDGTAVDGDTYTYVAQRVQTVTLAGRALEMRSKPSQIVTFTFHDVFPPKPPTSLVLIPSGGFGEAPSIDLSWDANLETDLAGYNVYRQEGSAEFVRLNAQPVPAPAFRDLRVEPGHKYTYRVTAVDQRHNESAPGADVSETLRR